MVLPVRKQNRLTDFDYCTPGAYFITICTKNRELLFWENVGATIGRPQDVRLSACGNVVNCAIMEIQTHYANVRLDYYVIMPNHIHLLLRILPDDRGRPMVAPTISTVIQQMKGNVSKQIDHSIWQKSFHDHVIRNEQDYLKIAEYILGNPMKWAEDCFYTNGRILYTDK